MSGDQFCRIAAVLCFVVAAFPTSTTIRFEWMGMALLSASLLLL